MLLIYTMLFIYFLFSNIFFQIRDRQPVYIFEDTLSGNLSEFPVEFLVTDKLWHSMTLSVHGANTFLSVDDQRLLNISGRSMELSPVNVKRFILGAAPKQGIKLQQSGELMPRIYCYLRNVLCLLVFLSDV